VADAVNPACVLARQRDGLFFRFRPDQEITIHPDIPEIQLLVLLLSHGQAPFPLQTFSRALHAPKFLMSGF
jgi:hypothetical protein